MIARPIRPSRRSKAATLRHCRAAGCTCTPDLTLVRWYSDDVQHHRAEHDADCPMIAGRTLAIFPRTSN